VVAIGPKTIVCDGGDVAVYDAPADIPQADLTRDQHLTLEHFDDLVRELLHLGECHSMVPVERGRVVEHRHAVDEPKQPDLQVVVLRGPLRRLLHPPLRRHWRRLGCQRPFQQSAADLLRADLDLLPVGRRQPAGNHPLERGS
jgi:hypothetical protein